MAADEKQAKPKKRFFKDGDLELQFADDVGVIYASDRFVINFFQAQPPLGIPEDGTDALAIDNKCIVQVVMTPEGMARVVNNIIKAYNGYYADNPDKMPGAKIEASDE